MGSNISKQELIVAQTDARKKIYSFLCNVANYNRLAVDRGKTFFDNDQELVNMSPVERDIKVVTNKTIMYRNKEHQAVGGTHDVILFNEFTADPLPHLREKINAVVDWSLENREHGDRLYFEVVFNQRRDLWFFSYMTVSISGYLWSMTKTENEDYLARQEGNLD